MKHVATFRPEICRTLTAVTKGTVGNANRERERERNRATAAREKDERSRVWKRRVVGRGREEEKWDPEDREVTCYAVRG